jgi:hypothetical protein
MHFGLCTCKFLESLTVARGLHNANLAKHPRLVRVIVDSAAADVTTFVKATLNRFPLVFVRRRRETAL